MRIKNLKVSRNWNGNPVLEITLPRNEGEQVEKLIDIESNKYELKIEKIKKKRSLDSNSYFWVLVGKIAQVTKAKSREDIYRSYIRETGAYEILPIREDAIERWKQIWQAKGEGWVTSDLGECRNLKHYHNIKCYYGTSVYDSKEMAHLIDLVVQDAKDLGIETLPPDELERMKSLWMNGQA